MKKRIFLFLWILAFNVNAKEITRLKSVNFLQEGEVSKLVLDFTKDVFATRNHIKSDKQIILDIKGAAAEKKLLRGIDTSEFSGSAVFVSPYIKPGTKNDLRFAIQLRDNVRSFVENKGKRIILHIENRFGVFTRSKLKKVEEGQYDSKGLVKEENVLVPKSNSIEDILENLTQAGVKRYVGRKISINVNNVEYKDVLKLIGDTSGFNIIIEDEVGELKPLTISLTNLPWDQVLDTVMDLGDLVALKFGNILTITTKEKARKSREQELLAESKNKNLEPLVTKFFPLSYAGADKMEKIVKPYLTKNRGTVQLDERTQNLIIVDTVDVVERIKEIIKLLDTQTPQILIESKIVEINEEQEVKMGLLAGGERTTGGVGFSYDPFSRGSSGSSGSFTFNTATSPVNNFLDATISVGKLSNLNFTLQLLENEKKARTITSPRIITENNKTATITDERKQTFYVAVPTTQGGTDVPAPSDVSIATTLKVTPKVTNEGSIIMKVDIQKGSLGPRDVGAAPAELKKTITTNVLVDNGSTVVIGGMYQNTESEQQSGVPFLKDLPLVGWLFKSSYNPLKTRAEVVVFLTPRIINQEDTGLVSKELGDSIGI